MLASLNSEPTVASKISAFRNLVASKDTQGIAHFFSKLIKDYR